MTAPKPTAQFLTTQSSALSRTLPALKSPASNDFLQDDAWAPTAPAWPTLSPDALPGFIGEFVTLATRNSEADPAAVLTTALVRFGAELDSPVFMVGETAHKARLFAAIVGASSKSRKGTSAAPVKKLFTFDESSGYAPASCHPGPLSSGEGLVYAVRDEVLKWVVDKKTGEGSMVVTDPGVLDKRLCVQDEELAAALHSTKRGGNSLSTALRGFWDHGNITPLTKKDRIGTTDAHVSLVTHITTPELAALLGSVQVLNGFANRFLWVCAQRRAVVAFPEPMHVAELATLRGELLALLNAGKHVGRVLMDQGARDLWEAVYPSLTQDHSGQAGCIVNRGEAQVIRLSLIYALLDGQQVIGERHLVSALAFWRYCHESAMVIFGEREVDPVTEKVLSALRSGPQSLTDLHRVTGNNMLTDRIKAALQELVKSGRVQSSTEKTTGRAKTVFKLNERNEFDERSSPAGAALPVGNQLALAV